MLVLYFPKRHRKRNGFIARGGRVESSAYSEIPRSSGIRHAQRQCFSGQRLNKTCARRQCRCIVYNKCETSLRRPRLEPSVFFVFEKRTDGTHQIAFDASDDFIDVRAARIGIGRRNSDAVRCSECNQRSQNRDGRYLTKRAPQHAPPYS